MIDLADLNIKFGQGDNLRFIDGPEKLVYVKIENAKASAVISLMGAQVISFTPKGYSPVLWMSPKSESEADSIFFGGVPVCFPWFADHPFDAGKPFHGFARLQYWNVLEAENLPDGSTRMSFDLKDDAYTRSLWPHSFYAVVAIIVGDNLSVELCIKNTDSGVIEFSEALHSYFYVGNVSEISVSGLDSIEYLDKAEAFTRKRQHGDIMITSETDRIYLDTKSDCIIHDKKFSREISVKKSGSCSTVVWNPWHTCENISEMTPDSYRNMICVETANVENDRISLAPGAEHRIMTNISVRSIS